MTKRGIRLVIYFLSSFLKVTKYKPQVVRIIIATLDEKIAIVPSRENQITFDNRGLNFKVKSKRSSVKRMSHIYCLTSDEKLISSGETENIAIAVRCILTSLVILGRIL